MTTDQSERRKPNLKDFLQNIERGQIASTLPDDDMTQLQGTKPGAAVTRTYSDNHTLKSPVDINTPTRGALVLVTKDYFVSLVQNKFE